VPAQTPPAVIATLNQGINGAIGDATIKARLGDLGGIVLPPAPPSDLGKLIADDIAKWVKVVKAAGIKPG
jgi:tripartite-type tricarboxylate transporter receptor subunit TctC